MGGPQSHGQVNPLTGAATSIDISPTSWTHLLSVRVRNVRLRPLSHESARAQLRDRGHGVGEQLGSHRRCENASMKTVPMSAGLVTSNAAPPVTAAICCRAVRFPAV